MTPPVFSFIFRLTSVTVMLLAFFLRQFITGVDTLWVGALAVSLLWVMDAQASSGHVANWGWIRSLLSGSSLPIHGLLLVAVTASALFLRQAHSQSTNALGGDREPATRADIPALVPPKPASPTQFQQPNMITQAGPSVKSTVPQLHPIPAPGAPGIDPITRQTTFIKPNPPIPDRAPNQLETTQPTQNKPEPH